MRVGWKQTGIKKRGEDGWGEGEGEGGGGLSMVEHEHQQTKKHTNNVSKPKQERQVVHPLSNSNQK